MSTSPHRTLLAISVASALFAAGPAIAGQLIADGTVETPTATAYETTLDNEHAFHARNRGQIIATGELELSTSGDGAAGVFLEGMSHVSMLGAEGKRMSVRTTGLNAAGIHINDGTLTEASYLDIQTEGDGSAGMEVEHGQMLIRDSTIKTLGEAAHGILKQGVGSGTVERVLITTGGDHAIGMKVVSSLVNVNDGTRIETAGEQAHGLVIEGVGKVNLWNSQVIANGLDAWGAVVDDAGSLALDGALIESSLAGRGGVRVRGGADSRLALARGSRIAGLNNIAVSLDAAVSGRFALDLAGSYLEGDIVHTREDLEAGRVSTAKVHVSLTGNSVWTGASTLLESVSLTDSWWVMGRGSAVGELQVRDGLVALMTPAHAENTVLSVTSDLHASNAVFHFSGALDGDDSRIGRIHVQGDAFGDGRVSVDNIGGLGAETITGIPLFQIDGASLADFTLNGRVVADLYEYFLHKGGVPGGEGNWYLRSEIPAPPVDPCESDPTVPGCPVDPMDPGEPTAPGNPGGPGIPGAPGDPQDPNDPTGPWTPGDPIGRPGPLLRSEAGAYLANQQAALNMFVHRLAERRGGMRAEDDRTVWARLDSQQADFDALGGQLLVDGGSSVLQVGSDLLRAGNAIYGVMLGVGNANSTVVSERTGYSAKGQVRGSAIGVYGTWQQDAGGDQGFYADGSLQHGRFKNRVQGMGLHRESYDSRAIIGALEGGYIAPVWRGASATLFVQPQVQLIYSRFHAGQHVERNGTTVGNAKAGGVAGRIGARVFGHSMALGNRVQPYLGVNWLRGPATNALDFNGQTLAVGMPRDRVEVQGGAELELGERVGAWGGVSLQRADQNYRNIIGQVGIRVAW